jgi:NTP pyrophosphatase (non-canonical NTP hydrolase)
MSEKNIYKDALNAFGAYTQLIVCAEEASELSAAILHYLRFGTEENKLKLEEEIADNLLTINQLIHMFDKDSINYFKSEKIKRLVKRIQESIKT